MVEKKQLLITFPCLGYLSFETRNMSNSCTRNQLPSCSLRIEFQSKPTYLTYLNSKTVFQKTFACILFISFRLHLIYDETERHLVLRRLEHLGITPLTQKRVKNTKKSAIIDHILLEGHNAT